MTKALPLDEIPVFGKNNIPENQTDLTKGGIFLINKPKEWSSFDVVKFLRKRIRVKKTGHAGTLDPLATGLLILCCGKATKSISLIQDLPKIYKGEFTFGAETATYDSEGEITGKASWKHITEKNIEEVLNQEFTGTIEQVPPMYSALKYGGKKLYELARKGEEVVRLPRQVTIYRHKILSYKPPKLTIEITCSKGTYIRSIARDLGEALQSKGFLSALERTAIGHYLLVDALTPHEMGDRLKEIWQN